MTKNDLKDEMKNRISLALKDPMLQQGFEIICKEIAELKEVNSDLKQSLDWANERESEDVNRIAELEKENAELKKQCDTLDKSLVVSTKNNIERQKIIDEYKERIAEFEAKLLQERETYWGKGFNYSKDQITQAKEIIKELLESCFGYASKSVNYEIKARAEKFLKESEE